MAPNRATAIDIGADSVRVATMRVRKGGAELLGAGLTSVAELDQNDPDYTSELAAAIRRVVKKNGIPVGYTVVGLSGRGTMVRYLGVPIVPPWKLSLVMGFEVEEQVGAGQAASNVAYDYRILSLPGFDETQFPMFLGLAQTPVIEERLQVCRRAVRRADDVDLQCLGAFNLFRRNPQCVEGEVSLLLDIGAKETYLTLQEGDSLLFARALSCGGHQFTTSIQKKLGLLGPEAEEYKRNQAAIIPRQEEDGAGEEACNASQACRAATGMLTSAVQSSLRYFYGQFKIEEFVLDKVVVTGGGSRLRGLADALQESFGCRVEPLDLAQAVRPVKASAEAALAGESAHHFAGAVGMALGQLTGGFSLSLLPPKIKERRRFWSREVYSYYAGALATVLLVLLFLGARRGAVYHGERNAAWKKHLETAKREHEELQTLQSENDRLYRRLRTLQVRKASGDDLLTCLGLLKEHIPAHIFFTQVETAGRIEEDGEAGAEAEAGPPGPRAQRATDSFQKSRYIVLRGYVVGARDEIEARHRLRVLADKLEGLEFFSRVQIMRQEPLEENAEEVAAAYEVAGRKAPPPQGVPLKFVMQCWITSEP